MIFRCALSAQIVVVIVADGHARVVAIVMATAMVTGAFVATVMVGQTHGQEHGHACERGGWLWCGGGAA